MRARLPLDSPGIRGTLRARVREAGQRLAQECLEIADGKDPSPTPRGGWTGARARVMGSTVEMPCRPTAPSLRELRREAPPALIGPHVDPPDAIGWTRVNLHASRHGEPVYRNRGFRDTNELSLPLGTANS